MPLVLRPRALAPWVVGCALAFAAPAVPNAHAAEGSARSQYDAGVKAFAAKRYTEAALFFEGAAELQRHAAALLMAARSWELADQPERAADDYGRATSTEGLAEKDAALARDRLATLEASLGTITVASEPGARGQIDKLTEVALPARLHAAPGVHVLTVRGSEWIAEKRVTLEAGHVDHVDVARAAPPPPPPDKVAATVAKPPPPREAPVVRPAPPPSSSTRRVVGVVVAGVGVASLATAGVLWFEANEAHRAYVDDPTEAKRDQGRTLVTWTNVALIGGAALTAVGVTLAVWPSPHTPVQASVAPGGLFVRGSF